MHAQSEPSAPCFSKTRGVLSVYWSSFAIIISLISLFIRWKDSIIYMLPTHSHIGYSNTSHAWLASLLTRISFLTECVLSVQLFFFFFYHWWWCRCLSALSKKAVPIVRPSNSKSKEVSSQSRSCAPDCGPGLSDKTTSPIQGQGTLATVCGALKCDTDAEGKTIIVQTQMKADTSA